MLKLLSYPKKDIRFSAGMLLTKKGHDVQTGSIRAIFWVYYQAALMFKDYKMFAYAVPPTGYLDPKLASWYALMVPSAICYYQGRLHLAIAGIVTMLGMIIFRRSSSSLFMFLWLSIFSTIYAAVVLFIIAPCDTCVVTAGFTASAFAEYT